MTARRNSLSKCWRATMAMVLTLVTTDASAGQNCDVVFRLTTAVPVGSMSWTVNYATSGGTFYGIGSNVTCIAVSPNGIVAAFDNDNSLLLTLGVISLSGLAGTVDVATCRFTSLAIPASAGFGLTVSDASNLDVLPIVPLPTISIGSINCQSSVCGDGILDPGEACDDGNLVNTDACLNSCQLPGCGDGIVAAATEECDDGNLVNTDACTSSCKSAKCGDGFVRSGFEQCDDANVLNTDGCTSTCKTATCGDGFIRASVEQCDDANTSNTDACLSSCLFAACGDGYLRLGTEQCDDGNVLNTDACTATCQFAKCGDGFLQAGIEQCDDGNAISTDACPSTCKTAVCGDGIVRNGVEECDDSNTVDDDGCSLTCETQRPCGDATDDGHVYASDALRILQRAVGLDVECPTWVCDVDGTKGVTAGDALRILRRSIDIPVAIACAKPTAIILKLTTSTLLGALQLNVDYFGARGEIEGSGSTVSCEVTQPDVTAAFNDKPERLLSASFVSLVGIHGPGALARCTFIATGDVSPNDFSVTIVDAKDSQGNAAIKPGLKVVPD